MMTLLLLLSVVSANQLAETPPPLSALQIAQIQRLVIATQERDEESKSDLARHQRALTEAYAEFELDETRISSLRNEIIKSQQQLLMNFHNLQAGLRKIVGPQQFIKLKQRIDLVFRRAQARKKKPENTATPKK
ncbi:MAG: hypothetical protein GY758_19820 [Fuerstiella sp.]|nr:hypothetical protein [Fuerstiella sp.]MCP4783735.1 hypothetical protein [Fuerstiella sp.]MCP4857030.1 hypothetical protein [Fuerstiella sp.]